MDKKVLLAMAGYEFDGANLEALEQYIENSIGVRPSLYSKVEVFRGRKTKDTILSVVLYADTGLPMTTDAEHPTLIANFILDIDELEMYLLEPVWCLLSTMVSTINNFNMIQTVLDSIIRTNGTGTNSGCAMHLNSDLE